jgi:hypothetical protein
MTFATKNQRNNKWQVVNDANHKRRMKYFVVKYKYGDFIHVSKDEFLWL